MNDKTTVTKYLGELDFVEVILPNQQTSLEEMAKTTHHLSSVFLVPYTFEGRVVTSYCHYDSTRNTRKTIMLKKSTESLK